MERLRDYGNEPEPMYVGVVGLLIIEDLMQSP